ncbi:MAG: type II secretion system protein [Verrucomicrobiae bacterium]|nr:type II secretion system protein [Verrucomicrobiae bacterium]
MTQPRVASCGERCDAFTLVELMVVVAIVLVLFGLTLPAIQSAQQRAGGIACLNNLKQLQVGWQLYADDHSGSLALNWSNNEGGTWRSTKNSWCGPSSAPRDQDEKNLQEGVLYSYCSTPQIFVCPSDNSPVLDSGKRRSRSYSVNSTFAGNYSFRAHPHPRFETLRKIEEAGGQAATLFVFVDEHEMSIDDGHFLVWPRPETTRPNTPAARHNRAGTFSFADGHCETRRWLGSMRAVKAGGMPLVGKQLKDLHWLQDHAHIR